MTVRNVNLPVKNEEGRKWFEIVLVLTVSCIGLNSGMLYCWTSPFLVKIVQDENYDITEEQASYFTVLSQIGVIVLPPFIAPIANHTGRKILILMTSIPFATAWIIKAFARKLWLFYLARLCSGFGDAVVFSCAMVYIAEVASPGVRGIWGNGLICFGFLGQFLINVFGIYFTIQQTSFICVIVPILFFIVFFFMPETPYFYIAKGREDEAKHCLRKLRRRENIEAEFKDIEVAVQNQLSSTGTWTELFTDKTNRRATFAAIYIRMSQIFAGLYTFAAYTQFIFQQSGTNISSESSTLIYTALNFVLYSSAAYGSNKLGRRKSLIISKVLTGITLTAEGIYFLIARWYPEVNLESVQWFPLAGMVAYLVFTSFGVGIVPSLMLGELFSMNCKAKGLALTTSIFGTMAFLINNMFYYLTDLTGLCGPFLLFGIANLISSLVTFYIIPETKNKTLEEIQQALRKL